jgi:hypothetical protein
VTARHRLLLTITAALLPSAAPAPSAAQNPFAAPHEVARDAGAPDLAINAAGDALLAVRGAPSRMAGDPPTGGEGVFVTARPAGAARFLAPVRLDDAQSGLVQVALNDRGDAIVAYVPILPLDPRPAAHRRRARRRARCASWRAPRAAASAPRRRSRCRRARHRARTASPVPARSGYATPRSRSGPDGTATIAWQEVDYAAERERVVAVVRRPDGSFGEPQVLDAPRVSSAPSVAADAAGRVVVAWSSAEPSGPSRVLSAQRGPGGGFGAPQEVPGSAGGAWPTVVAGRDGEAAVVFESGGSFASAGRLGGSFEPAQHFAQTGNRPTVAVGPAGDIGVVWSGPALFASVRAPGGAFDQPAETRYQGSVASNPLGVDALGTIVVLQQERGRLVAKLRPRGGAFGPAFDLAEDAAQPAMAPTPSATGSSPGSAGGAPARRSARRPTALRRRRCRRPRRSRRRPCASGSPSPPPCASRCGARAAASACCAPAAGAGSTARSPEGRWRSGCAGPAATSPR